MPDLSFFDHVSFSLKKTAFKKNPRICALKSFNARLIHLVLYPIVLKNVLAGSSYNWMHSAQFCMHRMKYGYVIRKIL